MWLTDQDAWHGNTQESSVRALAATAPVGVLGLCKCAIKIDAAIEVLELVNTEKLWASAQDQRNKCRGSGSRQMFDECQGVNGVFREMGDIEVADQQSQRLSARAAKFGFVDLLEDLGR